MQSDKKCEHCGEFEVISSFARIKDDGQMAFEANVITQCENYKNCSLFNKKN